MLDNLDPGSALIFKNDKQGNDARPDYTGEFQTPAGEQLRIALWIKTKNDKTFFSGKVSELQNVQQSMSSSGGTIPDDAQPVAAKTHPADEDIPF